MSGALWIVIASAGDFTSQLLESLPLGLRDQEGSEAAAQHEESKDLHHVVKPWGWVGCGRMALGPERPEDALSDDGTDFTRGSGDTVGSRAVSSREAFARDDERRGIRSEVEEELGEHVESQ